MKNFFKNNNTGAEQINANTEAIELLSEALDNEIANRQAGDTNLENEISLIESGQKLPESLKEIMSRFYITEGSGTSNNKLDLYVNQTLSGGGTGLLMSSSSSNGQQNYIYTQCLLPFMTSDKVDRIALFIGFDESDNAVAQITLQDTTKPNSVSNINLLNMQPKLTAGDGITISEKNVISASGSSGGIQSTATTFENLQDTMGNLTQQGRNIIKIEFTLTSPYNLSNYYTYRNSFTATSSTGSFMVFQPDITYSFYKTLEHYDGAMYEYSFLGKGGNWGDTQLTTTINIGGGYVRLTQWKINEPNNFNNDFEMYYLSDENFKNSVSTENVTIYYI